jgi:hypothetical protein
VLVKTIAIDAIHSHRFIMDSFRMSPATEKLSAAQSFDMWVNKVAADAPADRRSFRPDYSGGYNESLQPRRRFLNAHTTNPAATPSSARSRFLTQHPAAALRRQVQPAELMAQISSGGRRPVADTSG